MASTQPLVSVLISVYNAGVYLRSSLESILNQTHDRLEIFVVDDGSTDGCMEGIADVTDPRLRIMRQANAGKPVALNRALQVAQGEFYAIHDADDLSHPRRIERQVEFMRARPELAAVFSGYDLIINERVIAPRYNPKDEAACRRDIERFRMPSHDPTVMYRMSKARDFPYSEDLPVVEGLDHILRVGERHPLCVLGECLYSYRIHPQQITRQTPGRREVLLQELIRRACERRGVPYETVRPPQKRSPRLKSNSVKENYLSSHFIESVLDLRHVHRRMEAVRTGLFCSRLHPIDPNYHKALIYALIPSGMIPLLHRKA